MGSSDTQVSVSSVLSSSSKMNKLFLVALAILAALAQGGVVQREDVAELSAVGEAEVENIMEDVDDEEDELDDDDWEDDEDEDGDDEDDLEDDDEDDEEDDLDDDEEDDDDG